MRSKARTTARPPKCLGFVLATLVGACGGAQHQGATSPEVPSTADTAEASEPDAPPSVPPAAAHTAQSPATPPTSPGASVMPDTPPDPSRALPEVTLRRVGMHIGGESNDPVSKELFQRAIEAKSEDFLHCYTKVLEPTKGGVFGVDLFIRRAGGSPDVRQPRTGMQGEEFRSCIVDVFESVNFERPPKGPTVVSYSMKFEVSEPTPQ